MKLMNRKNNNLYKKTNKVFQNSIIYYRRIKTKINNLKIIKKLHKKANKNPTLINKNEF